MGLARNGLGFAGFGIACALLTGCGSGGASGEVVRVDAEFNPPEAADAFRPVHENTLAVAQTFTVQEDGRLEEFWFVITDGQSTDNGTIRITLQPVVAGVIDPDVADSLIDPIVVQTSSLPPVLVEEFTEFDIGDEPGRDVLAGDQYAIVVEFVSRATNNDAADPIALVLGRMGNPFADGNGATGELDDAFVNNTEDYFFRTFVLR
jgi:hypothetical protein